MNRTPFNMGTFNIRSLQAHPMRPALFGERMLCSRNRFGTKKGFELLDLLEWGLNEWA